MMTSSEPSPATSSTPGPSSTHMAITTASTAATGSETTMTETNDTEKTSAGSSTIPIRSEPSHTPHRSVSAATNQLSQSSSPTSAPLKKSPFSTPITSPPRSRPNQILIVNPTSTAVLTEAILSHIRPFLPHALEVTAYTASQPAPTAVDSNVDAALSTEPVLRDLNRYSTNNGETVQNFDGILIASFLDHPLIETLRESFDVPVVGIMEAALYSARMLGGRFGIITPSGRAKVMVTDAVRKYGLDHWLVGVEALHISALGLATSLHSRSNSRTGSVAEANNLIAATTNPTPATESSPSSPVSAAPKALTQIVLPPSRNHLVKRLTAAAKALVADGSDAIILGSEFLCSADWIRVVKDAVREDDGRRTVNVIDPVETGVMLLNGLVGMAMPTSKRGLYKAESEGRRSRGQHWL